jgi:hypothetical protein
MSWEFEWLCEVKDKTCSLWKYYTNYMDMNRTTWEWRKWEETWRTFAEEDPTDEKIKTPDLVLQESKSTLKFTCYSSCHYGYRWSINIGKINGDRWLPVLIGKRKAAILKAKGQWKTIGEYNDDAMAMTNDILQWKFDSFLITELRPNVYKNELFFSFNEDTWDMYEGVRINAYKTIAFEGLTLDVERTDDYLMKYAKGQIV